MKSNINLLIVAFLLISMTCFGQSGKLNFGFEVYTNFADRLGENDVLRDLEEPNLNVSGGFVLSYRIEPNIALISGFTLMNKGYQTKPDNLRWRNLLDGEEEASIRFKRNYYILSVPLNVRYAFGENLDKGWYIQGGIAPAFYWFDRVKVIQDTPDGKKVDYERNILDNARTVNLNFNYGGGYTFLLKEKFQISVGASLEYMPFDIVKDAVRKSSYYSYGLSTRFMVL